MATSKPTRADGQATRQQILKAAGSLFAQKGFDATTSKEICKKARVNIAAVNYHFDGKLALYKEVLIHAHNQLIELNALIDIQKQAICAQEKLNLVIDSLTKSALASPWQTKIFIREMLFPSTHFAAIMQEVIHREITPKLAIIRDIVSQIIHLPPEHPAVSRCIFNIAAPNMIMLSVKHNILNSVFNNLVPEHSSGHAQLTRHLQHAARLALTADFSALYANHDDAPTDK